MGEFFPFFGSFALLFVLGVPQSRRTVTSSVALWRAVYLLGVGVYMWLQGSVPGGSWNVLAAMHRITKQ